MQQPATPEAPARDTRKSLRTVIAIGIGTTILASILRSELPLPFDLIHETLTALTPAPED